MVILFNNNVFLKSNLYIGNQNGSGVHNQQTKKISCFELRLKSFLDFHFLLNVRLFQMTPHERDYRNSLSHAYATRTRKSIICNPRAELLAL